MKMTLKLSGMAVLAIALMACNRQPEAPQPSTATTPASTAPVAADAGATAAPDTLLAQAGDGKIATQEGVGIVEGNVLTGTGTAGFLAFGPYAPLAAGNYTVTFTGSVPTLPEGAVVRFDVTSSTGSQIHGEHVVSVANAESGEIAKLDFSLPTAVTDLEARVQVPEGAKVVLQSYVVTKR